MKSCIIFPLNHFAAPKFVVCLSKYQQGYLLSRHQSRNTWETQGGHIESGETPLVAAKRELFEESGAVDYDMIPAFEYSWEGSGDSGVVFLVTVRKLAALPESEIKEVQTFKKIPDNLTYPQITPVLFKFAEERFTW